MTFLKLLANVVGSAWLYKVKDYLGIHKDSLHDPKFEKFYKKVVILFIATQKGLEQDQAKRFFRNAVTYDGVLFYLYNFTDPDPTPQQKVEAVLCRWAEKFNISSDARFTSAKLVRRFLSVLTSELQLKANTSMLPYSHDIRSHLTEVTEELKRLRQKVDSHKAEQKTRKEHIMKRSRKSITNVFLCYAHEDLDAAHRLHNLLSTEPNIEIWFDKISLLTGQRWEVEIKKAISESRYFLLLLSKNSTTKKGFYQREVRFALNSLDTFPENEIFLLPIRLDDCEPHFEQLKGIQYVDLFPEWGVGFQQISKVLQMGHDLNIGGAVCI